MGFRDLCDKPCFASQDWRKMVPKTWGVVKNGSRGSALSRNLVNCLPSANNFAQALLMDSAIPQRVGVFVFVFVGGVRVWLVLPTYCQNF